MDPGRPAPGTLSGGPGTLPAGVKKCAPPVAQESGGLRAECRAGEAAERACPQRCTLLAGRLRRLEFVLRDSGTLEGIL